MKQGNLRILIDCENCNGKGNTINHPCNCCNEKGTITKMINETIIIPKGVNNKIYLRMPLKGHSCCDGHCGDLYLHIRTKANQFFKRDINNIEEFANF